MITKVLSVQELNRCTSETDQLSKLRVRGALNDVGTRVSLSTRSAFRSEPEGGV
jgi:hypothetical protein